MPTQSNVYCGCGTFMRIDRNGVTVEETLDNGAPYKLWRADRYVCPECASVVIVGFAQQPLAEHYQHARYAAIRNEAIEDDTYIAPKGRS